MTSVVKNKLIIEGSPSDIAIFITTVKEEDKHSEFYGALSLNKANPIDLEEDESREDYWSVRTLENVEEWIHDTPKSAHIWFESDFPPVDWIKSVIRLHPNLKFTMYSFDPATRNFSVISGKNTYAQPENLHKVYYDAEALVWKLGSKELKRNPQAYRTKVKDKLLKSKFAYFYELMSHETDYLDEKLSNIDWLKGPLTIKAPVNQILWFYLR